MFKKVSRLSRKQTWLISFLFVVFIGSLLFVHNNHSFYERTIVKVMETHVVERTEVVDIHHNADVIYDQELTTRVMNGLEKGSIVHLTNTYSFSRANDHAYTAGDELFVALAQTDDEIKTGIIQDVKRDTYVLYVAWLFVFTLLIIGKRQGLYSIFGLAINAAILSFALDIYVKNDGLNLLVIAGFAAILFTIISLALMNGWNEKTHAAISATLIGTFLSLLIAYLVLWATGESGLRYEEMQFLSRPYEAVFIAGLFLGSLGGVMDIAITMSSSIFGIYEKDQTISLAALRASGQEIGKDIMGTMTNILFFVYISGSIPMLILYLNNSYPTSLAFSMNISLEVARALAGGIGIVLAIPISLYTSLYFVKRKERRR